MIMQVIFNFRNVRKWKKFRNLTLVISVTYCSATNDMFVEISFPTSEEKFAFYKIYSEYRQFFKRKIS